MPRPPKRAPTKCAHFVWRLFRRDGVWYADGRNGSVDLRKHSLGTRDHEEALRVVQALDARMAVEHGLASPESIRPGTAISIQQGWNLYLEHVGRSPVLGGATAATLKRYKAVRDKHMRYCAERPVGTWNAFDKAALVRYGNWLSSRRSERTQFLELTLLKSINKWLVEEKLLPADARIKHPLRKPSGTDTYCYAPAEVRAIIEHCQAKLELIWLGHVVTGLAHTGMRISELSGLRWSDIDLSAGVIRVADERSSRRKQKAGTARTTKGKRSRSIPIHPRLRALFVSMARSDDGFVFHAARGGRLRPNNVLHQFVEDVIEVLKKGFPTPEGEIGFEHGRIHSFRHFFCSQAFLGGASEGEVREWMGHADSKIVEHYRHLRADEARRKMNQIDFLGRDDRKDSDSHVA